MLVKLALYLSLAIAVFVGIHDEQAAEELAVGGLGVAACGSMIFFSRFWASYVLPFGFWESFASDAGSPSHSAPAIALMGWLLLAVMAWASF